MGNHSIWQWSTELCRAHTELLRARPRMMDFGELDGRWRSLNLKSYMPILASSTPFLFYSNFTTFFDPNMLRKF